MPSLWDPKLRAQVLRAHPLARRDGTFRYSVTVTPLPEPRITAESLVFGSTMLFREVQGSGSRASADIRVEYNNFAQGGIRPRAAVSATRSVLSQYERFATKNRELRESLQLIGGVRNHLRASFVFDPKPDAMRRYERIGHDSLLRDGSNLSSVLYGLRNNGEAKLDELFGHIRQVPDEPYSGFDFVTTQLGDVIFGLYEERPDHLSDARMLSDGTLRTLAVLTAVTTAERHSRVVVEEFDNGLHPSRVASLIQAITRSSEERKINVLLSTHNPEVLNALTPEQQRSVVLAFRSRTDYCSRLLPLIEVERYDELLEKGRLGDLVSHRGRPGRGKEAETGGAGRHRCEIERRELDSNTVYTAWASFRPDSQGQEERKMLETELIQGLAEWRCR